MSRVSHPSLVFGSTQAPTALAGTQYTQPIHTGAGGGCSFHLEWDGTPATAITAWSTNRPANRRNDAVDDDWVEETAVVIAATGGAAGKAMVHINDVQADEVRLKFVTSAGAGGMEVWGKSGA
jgi:hypothetical protein